MRQIYLDTAATTRCTDEVTAAMLEFSSTHYGNPSSPHGMGLYAKRAVVKAGASIARLIGCSQNELTITSGATESNNIVILGCSESSERRRNIVICPIDHKSSLEAANELARRGIEVRQMRVDHHGRVDIEELGRLVDDNTALVTISHVNSEIGTLQNILEIGKVLSDSPAIFHVDASQAAGKVDIDVSQSGIDCLSLSAHKISGPKGIGALYVAEAVVPRLKPLTFGGGQFKLRSGTLPSQLIVGFGVAADRINNADLQVLWDDARIRQSTALEILENHEIKYLLNSSPEFSVPHILNVSFPGVRSETIINGLNGVCVASGSACNSESMAPSYVLTGVGHSGEHANCSIRLSFSADMDINELKYGMEALAKKVRSLQELTMSEAIDV